MKFYVVNDLLYVVDASNKAATLLIQNGKSVQEKKDYSNTMALIKSSGKEISAADAKARQKAAGKLYTSSGDRIAPGTYSDQDGYSYEVSSSSVTIYKKSGAKWKTISSGDSAWAQVMANLAKDQAAGKLKSGKADPKPSFSTATFTPSVMTLPTYSTDLPSAEAAVTTAITDEPWFWPVVGGTGLLMLAGTLYLAFGRNA